MRLQNVARSSYPSRQASGPDVRRELEPRPAVGLRIAQGKERMKRIMILVAIAIALLAIPSAALAQGSSTCQAYNPQLCTSVGDSTSSGTLPFTGVNVGLMLAGGATLIGAGFVVRRLARNPS
jgi:hypothetical protein